MSCNSENRKSYSKLAQIHNALRRDFTLQSIEKIISKEGNINCRMPSHSFIKSSEPASAGGTALHIALSRRNNQVVEELLNIGADYTIKNADGLTALHFIATSDFYSLSLAEKFEIQPYIDAILSAHIISKKSVNPCNNDGLSHLHIACMVNNNDAVELFLKNGEDVNQTVNGDASCNPGYTPLHFAVKCHATETVKILLDHGANVFSKDIKGMTPLHLLLEQNMRVYDSINMDMEFSIAVQEDIKVNEDIVSLLLEKTSDDKLIAGLSRLHIACISQDTSMVERILENANDINHPVPANSQMWPGYTGLHFAAHCNVNTVKMLLSRGADLEVRDARGVSPFDICLERYKMRDIHAIVSQKQEWKDILLSDGKIRLTDLLFAMANPNRLKILLQSSIMYINAYIPESSKLWPGCTPLHLAVTFSERHKKSTSTDYPTEPDLDLVKECLDDGADVTIKDSRGWTALNLAYRQSKMRVVNLLLRCHHVLVNPTDKDNLSHLHIACAAQNEILVENLLLRTGDVNIVYKGSAAVKSIKPGYTPLHIAVAKKNSKIMEILMRHGADINFVDFNGCTPIHETLCVDKSIVKLMFSSSTLRECVVDGVGLSHLHIASENNDVDVVERLMQLGAEIDGKIVSDKFADNSPVPDRYRGCTALHVAVMCHALDVVIFLLEHGADILAKSADGSTPLSKALDYKNRKCFRYFVPILRGDEDLQVRMEKETGMTMLHIACHLIDVDEVEGLLGKGANVNAQIDKDSTIWAGCTSLHVLLFKDVECVFKYNEELHNKISVISEILLDRGTNVTLVDAEGDTPIHISFMLDHGDTRYLRVRQLMNFHADFNVNPTSAKGLSHFHLACMVNDTKAVEKFLQCGIDVNEPIDYFSDKYPGCSSICMAIDARSSRLFGTETLLETVNLFLRHDGVNVCAEDSHGYTALHNAARTTPTVRKLILERILSAGADINSSSIYGETPLELLLLTEEIAAEEIRFFVQHNAHINSCNPNNDKGYLSMLLSKDHHTNQQTAAFEEMMKAPDIARVDKMGRTAIHNVVTTAKPNISTENYIQLINMFTKFGCDVDDQDKSGLTALHLAGQFGNKEATVALLTFGADVNIIDASNKSAFSYAIEICRKCDKTPTHRHTEVIQALALHLHKLQLLDLDVTQLNANLKRAMCPRIDVEEKFQEEVDLVRQLEITRTSLVVADFLRETKAVIDYPYMNLRERNSVDEFFESIQSRDVEQLKGILMLQYRKAVSRLRLVEFAVTALRSLLGFPLPDLCCEVIFNFLRNEDLKNLIASAGDDT